jgi:hypothetical protein
MDPEKKKPFSASIYDPFRVNSVAVISKTRTRSFSTSGSKSDLRNEVLAFQVDAVRAGDAAQFNQLGLTVDEISKEHSYG